MKDLIKSILSNDSDAFEKASAALNDKLQTAMEAKKIAISKELYK